MPKPPAYDPDQTRLLPRDDNATVLHPATLADDATRLLTRLTANEIPIALPAGQRLHEYRIDSVLGQGGFGITYLATDVNLNSKVAIKEYLPAELAQRELGNTVRPRSADRGALFQHGLERFLFEARTLATFRHPNIVRVARFFEANHTAYMVLDYERGLSLKQWWAQRGSKLGEAELLTLLHPLLDGLALVHRSGVLHRDIKPDNLCVRQSDGSLVLLDFGAARVADAGSEQAASEVTPGYAPIEQYLGQHQGPWTDLYALGATLYWLVAGRAPREAPDRLAAPEADASAESLGAGRFSTGFLQAIDWALAIRAADRPQTVAAFRPILFAAHSGSLALQEALALESDAPANAPKALRGLGRKHFRRHLLHPGSWPLALKMSLILIAAALLPMILTGYYNYAGSVALVEHDELKDLSQLAQGVAGRVAQLVEDSRRLDAYLAADPELLATLAQPDDAHLNALRQRFGTVLAANPDTQLLMLMDLHGVPLVATDPSVVGRDLGFRDYFRSARSGIPYTSGVTVGTITGVAGVFISYPVLATGGIVRGVAVLRLKAEPFARIVNAASGPSRTAFMIDSDGILIHHPDPRLLYQSLDALPAGRMQEILADQRFQRHVVRSLQMPALASMMVGAQTEGHVSYHSPISGVEEVAGFAPVVGHNWVVGVTESRDTFEAPLRDLFERVLASMVAVGAAFTLLAWLFARSIVRPIRRLTESAHALKRGDFDAAGIRVESSDEIGELAVTFNVMVDVLRQRERERSRGTRAPD